MCERERENNHEQWCNFKFLCMSIEVHSLQSRKMYDDNNNNNNTTTAIERARTKYQMVLKKQLNQLDL